ncbi:MAG: right-handed parallel beta-helix repeat-containing protein, partial [Flavobacteriaceae bacterium]|nr:right-handed parallel beta-helix repeat-containing protein [Flavobacteriaceae bacterium]
MKKYFSFNKAIILIVWMLVSLSSIAQTYYISNDGNDGNDGLTEATPWKTLAKASAAAERSSQGGFLQPGDKLLFKKDDTFVGQLILWCSGTKANPIEIGSYGTGELPILTGVGANIGNNNDGDAIEVIKMTNTSHILINDLWITNDRQVGLGWAGSGNTSYGILVKANKWGGVSKGLTFRNLKFTDIFGVDMLDWEGKFTRDYYNAKGIFFDSNADEDTVEVGIDDVLIEDCYFFNLGSTGISARHLGSYNNPVSDDERNLNYVIRNNTFKQLGGDGVVFASVNNGLVENNEFID